MQDAAWDGAADLRARLEPQPRSWIVIATMAFGTLGIIYGDIGTSPLYTFAGIFSGVDNTDADDAKMGLSLIFWTLTLVVMIKYVLIVLRADDNGEGGTFALYSRLCRSMGLSPFGTLQAQEHEQLVTISKRGPPPVPASARINRPSRSLMRNHTPSSRFQPMSSGPQRLTSADSTSVPLGQAPGATPALTGAPSPLVTLSRLGGGMHLNPQAVLPEDASYCEALDQGRMALRPPATQAALDKMESCESGEASGRKQQEGPVSAKDVGVRIPSTSALVGMPEVARTPRHWWSRGALPAEAFKRMQPASGPGGAMALGRGSAVGGLPVGGSMQQGYPVVAHGYGMQPAGMMSSPGVHPGPTLVYPMQGPAGMGAAGPGGPGAGGTMHSTMGMMVYPGSVAPQQHPGHVQQPSHHGMAANGGGAAGGYYHGERGGGRGGRGSYRQHAQHHSAGVGYQQQSQQQAAAAAAAATAAASSAAAAAASAAASGRLGSGAEAEPTSSGSLGSSAVPPLPPAPALPKQQTQQADAAVAAGAAGPVLAPGTAATAASAGEA